MKPLVLSIFASVVAAAVVWCTQYLRRRYYLLRSVSDDVVRQRENVTEIRDFLAGFFGTTITIGRAIDVSARFERSDGTVAQALTSEVTQHAPGLLRQVIALYEMVRTIEVLFGNFMTEVTLLKNSGQVLSEADVRYLAAKAWKILAMCRSFLLATETTDLSNLPCRYNDEVPALDMYDAILAIYRATNTASRVPIRLTGEPVGQLADRSERLLAEKSDNGYEDTDDPEDPS